MLHSHSRKPSVRSLHGLVCGLVSWILAGATGLEPVASCMTGARSNQLPYSLALTIPIVTVRSFPCSWDSQNFPRMP